MKKKAQVILSVSSDIGANFAYKLLKENKIIIGTYRKSNKHVKNLKKLGCILYKIDFENKKQISNFAAKVKNYNVTKLLSAVGSQEPVGKLIDVNLDQWEKSILVNAVNQIRCIVQIYKTSSLS